MTVLRTSGGLRRGPSTRLRRASGSVSSEARSGAPAQAPHPAEASPARASRSGRLGSIPSSSTSSRLVSLYLQRLRLAPGPVEGAHQLTAQLLPKRVCGDEGLELPDESACRPSRSSSSIRSPVTGQPKILETRDLRSSEVLEREFLQRRPSPEPERPRSSSTALSGSCCERASATSVSKRSRSSCPGSSREQITGRAREDQLVVGAGWPGWSSRRRCDTYVWITLAADSGRARPRCRRSAVRSRPPRSRAGAGSGGARAPGGSQVYDAA